MQDPISRGSSGSLLHPGVFVDGKQGSARLGKECSPNVSMNDQLALVSLPEISPGHFGDLSKASLPLVLPVSDKSRSLVTVFSPFSRAGGRVHESTLK
jgi:hypothetical protein